MSGDIIDARRCVLNTLDCYDTSRSAKVLVKRDVLDVESRKAIVADVYVDEVSSDDLGEVRKLIALHLGDLAVGRPDRIIASDAAWCRAGCVACGLAAFEAAADTVCDECALLAAEARAEMAALDAELAASAEPSP